MDKDFSVIDSKRKSLVNTHKLDAVIVIANNKIIGVITRNKLNRFYLLLKNLVRHITFTNKNI